MLLVEPIGILPDFRIASAYTEFTVQLVYIDFCPGKTDTINKFAQFFFVYTKVKVRVATDKTGINSNRVFLRLPPEI